MLQGEAHPWLILVSEALTVVLTPELFERFLPCALLAGLTRQWAAAFQGILEAPPSWNVGSGDFDLTDFGTSLGDCFSSSSGGGF